MAFLFIHLISLVVGFGAVIVIDTYGLLWLLKWWGVDLRLVRRVAVTTQRLIWVGFTGLVISGAAMLYMKGSVSDQTMLKLFFVLMVGLNGIFLHTIKKSLDALGDNVEQVPPRIFFRIGLASTISQLGWWGATIIGFVNRQMRITLSWAEHYPIIIANIVVALGVIALVGHLLTKPKAEVASKPESDASPDIQNNPPQA